MKKRLGIRFALLLKIFPPIFPIIDMEIFDIDFIFKEIINTLKHVIFVDWLKTYVIYWYTIFPYIAYNFFYPKSQKFND